MNKSVQKWLSLQEAEITVLKLPPPCFKTFPVSKTRMENKGEPEKKKAKLSAGHGQRPHQDNAEQRGDRGRRRAALPLGGVPEGGLRAP